jgi:hypothetical protein
MPCINGRAPSAATLEGLGNAAPATSELGRVASTPSVACQGQSGNKALDAMSAGRNTRDAFATKPSAGTDLVGQTFGRWTVISVHPQRDRKTARSGLTGLVSAGGARRLTGRARALFDRRHRLASRPCEGVDLFFQGERLGRVSAMLPSVAVPSRSGSAGAMHPADRVAPNRRRSAL